MCGDESFLVVKMSVITGEVKFEGRRKKFFWVYSVKNEFQADKVRVATLNFAEILYFCLSMHNPPEILAMACRNNLVAEQMNLLQQKSQMIPGSVQYTISRYYRTPQWSVEDTGMVVYHFEKDNPKENYLELRFCISGNVYCKKKDTECDMCQ